jgi:hypothetical protein
MSRKLASSVRHRRLAGAKARSAALSRRNVVILRSYPTSLEGERDVLLRTQDVADVLGVTDQYVREKGTSFLPSVRVGRFRRYKLSDLLDLIERSTEPVRPDDDRQPKPQKGGQVGNGRSSISLAGSSSTISRAARQRAVEQLDGEHDEQRAGSEERKDL